MKITNPSTPTPANYRILQLIEQLLSVVPKGTALGLSDLTSAMFSGYFIESGGAVTPAIEAFLRQKIRIFKKMILNVLKILKKNIY